MTSFDPVIIVVAFSRPAALKRLLNSINSSEYNDEVELIISIDGGADPFVCSIADEFKFKHGYSKVIKHSRNLGLKEHILKCGDLTKEYGSVIILEDDILVDKHFYTYAKEALEFYQGQDNVAGISLYAPEYNEFAGLPFSPVSSEFDTYFMQVPSSWGQAWNYDQWASFRKWLLASDEVEMGSTNLLPDYVKRWKSSSWKKLFYFYLCCLDKYFVYPYKAFSTNVSDPGGFHNVFGSDIVQVHMPLQGRKYRPMYYPVFSYYSVVYDAFMENKSEVFLSDVKKVLGIAGSLTLDLYGLKDLGNIQTYDYCISIKRPASFVRTFSCRFRPVEMNLLYASSSTPNRIFYLFLAKTSTFLMSKTSIKYLLYWAGFDFLAKKNLSSLCVGILSKVRGRL